MKRSTRIRPFSFSCFVVAALAVATAADAQRRRAPRPVGLARWAPDGVHVVSGGKWYEPRSWREVRPVPEKAKAPDPREQAIRAFQAAYGKPIPREVLRGDRTPSTLPRRPEKHPGLKLSADGKVAVLVIDGVLWAWRKGGPARKVTEGFAGVRRLELAPRGSAVSYIREFDLYVTDLADGRTRRLTDDGGENSFNGELDWVYQEEVYGRFDFKATWWAPDDANLAFLRIDETGVDTFVVVDHLPQTLRVETLKYPKAGRTNPRATLWVAGRGDGRKVAVDLGRYAAEEEILIVRVGWTPGGEKIELLVQNREQTWLDLDFADPRSGKLERVLRETCEDGWVERLPLPRWLGDGTFLWESDRTGYRHIYRYAADGKLLHPVTHGEWTVRSILRVDEDRGFLLCTGTTEDYVIGNHAYVASLDGKRLRRITKGRGTHMVSLDAQGELVLDAFTSLEKPAEQWLRTVDGKDLRRIAERKAPPDANVPRWHRIRARDGEWLDVTFRLPRGFDPKKKCPVWIETYSGPDAPTIRDVWQGPRASSDWYVDLRVNVRSASGRGMKFTKTCYRRFGVQELKDLEDAVDWLCEKYPWADASRVGISGWSYGGFMAAFALTHSKKFKCGIAGGGVYDWRLYDTIYTERYMALPQNNPRGYRASSVVAAAKNLHGKLLIVHGTMDENVHFQNAIQLVHALEQAGNLDFVFVPYARSRHGVRSRHLAMLRRRFMKENL